MTGGATTTDAERTTSAASDRAEPTDGGEPARRRVDPHVLFAPRSIAVLGASPRSDLARTVRDNVGRVGGSTPCWFVNPRYTEVDGSPCHPDLAALPDVPDTVVLAVNPLRAAEFTRHAASAGARSVVIPGGGVVEGGDAAARMQADVAAIARETGITVLGPNCMGVVDLTTSSATYIGDLTPWLRRGGVAGIAQSGSVTDAFVHAGTRIGWSRIVSCGSESVLDVCDYLAYCLDDPETSAVVLFLEGLKRPERFLALADRALAAGVPILAVKVGRSDQAQLAAIAHSGTLAGDDRVVDAAFEAAGVVRFDDLDELLEAAALVTGTARTGRAIGAGRTAVVTVSTGEGSLIADVALRLGLDLPPVPDPARSGIVDALPTLGYVGNPMDPWGAGESAPTYRACFDAFVASGAYDVLALVHDFPFRSQHGEVELATELAGELVAATAGRPEVMPVFVSLTSGDATPEVQELLDAAGGVPILRGTVEAFGAIARMAWWERRRAARLVDGPWRPNWPALAAETTPFIEELPAEAFSPPGGGGRAQAVPGVPARVAVAGDRGSRAEHEAFGERSGPRDRTVLAEHEALALLSAAGVPVVEAVLVGPEASPSGGRDLRSDARAAARRLGWPIVVKLDAAGVAHASDVGGVVLDVRTDEALDEAVDRVLAGARAAGIEAPALLVERDLGRGLELIVGARRDPQLGPVVLVGLGGRLAELLDDVVVALAPLSVSAATALLDRLRGTGLLDGWRREPPVDRNAVGALVAALGDALVANREWLEVDLNPVIVSSDGPVAVDALIVRAATERRRPPSTHAHAHHEEDPG